MGLLVLAFSQAFTNDNVSCTKDIAGPEYTCHEDLFWRIRRADIGLLPHYRFRYQKTHCSGLHHIYDPCRDFLARQEGYTQLFILGAALGTLGESICMKLGFWQYNYPFFRSVGLPLYPCPWLGALARLLSEESQGSGRRSRKPDCRGGFNSPVKTPPCYPLATESTQNVDKIYVIIYESLEKSFDQRESILFTA